MSNTDQLSNLADVATSAVTKKRKIDNDTTTAPVVDQNVKHDDANTLNDDTESYSDNDRPTPEQQFANLSMLRSLLDTKALYLAQTMSIIDQKHKHGSAAINEDDLAKFKRVVNNNNETLKKYSGIYNPDFILQTQLLDCKEIYLNRLSDYLDRKANKTFEDDRISIVKTQLTKLDVIIHLEMSMLSLEIAQQHE